MLLAHKAIPRRVTMEATKVAKVAISATWAVAIPAVTKAHEEAEEATDKAAAHKATTAAKAAMALLTKAILVDRVDTVLHREATRTATEATA